MGDGLYGDMLAPWIMGRTVVHIPLGSWIVQWYSYPMGDGLYSGTLTPWVMGCTVIHFPHG